MHNRKRAAAGNNAGEPVLVSLAHSQTFGTSPQNITTSSFSFGAEPDPGHTRHIIAIVFPAGDAMATGGSIGGNALSELYVPVAAGGGAGQTQPGFWIAEVPTGASGTATINFPTTTAKIIAFLIVYDFGSLFDFAATGATAITNPSIQLDVPKNGVIIAAGRNLGTDMTGDWTGATDILNFGPPSGSSLRGSVALFEADANYTNRTIQITTATVTRLSGVGIAPA